MRAPSAWTQDSTYLRRCFSLARRAGCAVGGNPQVGCVIVKDGEIVGEGWHHRWGAPHAEVEALAACRVDPRGATLYVSLEPCHHHGKTPPCTEAILRSGVAEVVVGTEDPNPLVGGRGLRALREAGVVCRSGILESQARALIAPFRVYLEESRPFVTAKLAQTINGMIAVPEFPDRYFSSVASLCEVHRLRATHDAVLIGAGTLRQDDPELTVRHVRGPQPLRIVLTKSLELPESATLFRHSSPAAPVMIVTGSTALRAKSALVSRLRQRGIRFVTVPRVREGHLLNPRSVLDVLSAHGVYRLLLEGGADVFSGFLQHNVIDALHCVVTPHVAVRGEHAFSRMTDPYLSLRERFHPPVVKRQQGDVWMVWNRRLEGD